MQIFVHDVEIIHTCNKKTYKNNVVASDKKSRKTTLFQVIRPM